MSVGEKDLGDVAIVSNPKDCTFNARQVVTVHSPLPKGWQDPFRAGFSITCGAIFALSLVSMLAKLLKWLWA